ncbi:hypothetical protein [Streptomyces turgidiscabies]|uniref:Uncharacterized protein n=1 Tax=Streptomyces turgidiscabies TaxID=85558 RepID=A0ABU0RRL9_9ACTN|nr:hypothetical protein [Streptomyces turgidiscabies]MDQ0934626.1 hypothetical protein [Streptomyces turgidiscabies]
MIGAHMDHDDDNPRNLEQIGIGGVRAFLAEFESCHDELSLSGAEMLMEFEPAEEIEGLSQILLTRQTDVFELLSSYRFHRSLDAPQGGVGVAYIYAALVIGPKFCAVEAGTEVDLDQDLGTIPAGTRTPYHWKREGIPFDEAFTVLREQTRALTKLKDPFTTSSSPEPHN